MIGAIAGDIIGSRWEVINYSSNKSFENYLDFPLFTEQSKFTDDTVLSCAIAKVLMENYAEYVLPQKFAEQLKLFGRKYPLAGYGSSFIQWLDAPGLEPGNSWGNGAAMRVSAVGFACKDIESVLRVAKLSALTTHGHPEGIAGAQAIAACIHLATIGYTKTMIKDFVQINFQYNLNQTLDEIRPTYEFSSYARDTVPQAIIAFLEGEDYETTVRKAISIGGDSDTIACMAGGIAQAFYGIESIPKEIVENTLRIVGDNSDDLLPIINKFTSILYEHDA